MRAARERGFIIPHERRLGLERLGRLRDIAKLYAEFASGGHALGTRHFV